MVKYIGSGDKTNHVQQKILSKCVFGRALYTSLYREQKDIHTSGHLHFLSSRFIEPRVRYTGMKTFIIGRKVKKV